MKKFFYLLLALPLAIFATSCNDDDKDVPDVGLEASFNAAQYDGGLYVVQGDTLTIERLDLVNHTNKNGGLGSASYYIDNFRVGTTILQPYTFSIVTEGLPIGVHTLGITAQVLVVDYPINLAAMEFPLNIVASADDIPAGAVIPVLPDQPAE
ncbi:MAG: hypothetical protein K2N79_02875 [Muribaculaceae bacterium]|nr:hypothetical protein [Muribaculaceae bacterium]MDE7369861.1 hypothetical protein [Muribaculaceae bacterium]